MTEWRLRTFIRAMLATFMGRSRITRSASSDTDAPVDTVEMSGDPSEPAPSPMTRVEQYGEIVVPPNDSQCVYLTLNDQGLVWSLNTQRPAGVSARGNRGLFTDAENRIILRGKGDVNAGQVEVVSKTGARAILDKDGQWTIVPAPGKKIRLGDDVDVNLDAVPTFAALKTAYDAHLHTNGNMGANTGVPTVPMPASVACNNVVVKK